MTTGEVGFSGAAAGSTLEIELNAGIDAAGGGTAPAAGAVAPVCAGRLEIDVKLWAPALTAVPS
jgi:hypothetical protein